METLIKSVQEKLKTAVPELRWIDQDFGQFELEKPPVDFPCALIDIPDIQYSDSSNLEQIGDTTLTVRLGFRVYNRSNSKAPDMIKEKGRAHFAIIKKVYKVLHGHEDDEANYNTITRATMLRGKSIDPRVYTLGFKTALFETNEQATTHKPDLELEFKKY